MPTLARQPPRLVGPFPGRSPRRPPAGCHPVVTRPGALPGPHHRPARLPARQRTCRRPQRPPVARRRRHPRRAALVVTTALVVVFWQRNTAVQQRDQAIYNQTVAEALTAGASNIPLAAQLNLAAYRLQPTQYAASRLLDAENTPLSSALTVGTGGVGRSRSALRGTCWPAAPTTARSGCGMPPTPCIPSHSPSPWPSVPPSFRWRSAPMGTRWPAATTTARSGCGTSPIPGTPWRSRRP